MYIFNILCKVYTIYWYSSTDPILCCVISYVYIYKAIVSIINGQFIIF